MTLDKQYVEYDLCTVKHNITIQYLIDYYMITTVILYH